ncbi:helix-turn-helix domain-containing protein, partial [Streptomyces sp. NPDC002463]|uniref:helix-turn-helix domain-containing protein n=1 Tax=Streptomyces sp. NPDC002463 TaxID=3364645 RepID=UPI0036C3F84B
MEGRDRAEVAALFRASVRAVDNWWARWQAGGRGALLSRPRGRRAGEHQVLSEAEQAAIRQTVLDHIPRELGLSDQLWTRGADRSTDLQAVGSPVHRARRGQIPQAVLRCWWVGRAVVRSRGPETPGMAFRRLH